MLSFGAANLAKLEEINLRRSAYLSTAFSWSSILLFSCSCWVSSSGQANARRAWLARVLMPVRKVSSDSGKSGRGAALLAEPAALVS